MARPRPASEIPPSIRKIPNNDLPEKRSEPRANPETTFHFPMKHLHALILATALLLTPAPLIHGETLPAAIQSGPLKVAYVLDSGMVLQREMPTPIWGWDKPGTTVTVSFGGQKTTAQTDANGTWTARLAPMKANATSQDMTIADGTNTVTIKDILVGDVWLLSGQSNMETKTGSLMKYGKDAQDPITGPLVKKVVDHCNEQIFKNLDEPRLRYLQVPRCAALEPQRDFDRTKETGVWGKPTPVKRKWVSARADDKGGSVEAFSGLGFSFAYELLKKTGVPIGLIDTSKGGTIIEAWMDAETTYQSCDFGKKRVLTALVGVKTWQDLMATRNDEAEFTKFVKDADATRAEFLEFIKTKPVVDFFTANKDQPEVQRLAKNLDKFKAENDEYLKKSFVERVKNRASGPTTPKLGGRSMQALKPPKGQPIVRKDYAPPKDPRKGDTNEAAQTSFPGAMYLGTLTPVMPMGIKGVIWYQGENNHFHDKGDIATQYDLLLNGMIKSWRKAWGQGDFPFYIVQLPNTPGESTKGATEGTAWVFLADAQRKSLITPHTGLGVACDIGGDLHWQNKYDLGWRLSLLARANLFGEKIESSGPLYKSQKIEGNKVLVTFDHVGGGIASGIKTDIGPATLGAPLLPHHKFGSGDLQYFQIAGAPAGGSQQWHWAKAMIIGKDTVEVSSPEVKEPQAVRYLWAKFAQVPNFYNKEGLPAAVFRTDDWEWSEGWDRRTASKEVEQLRATCREKGILPSYAK